MNKLSLYLSIFYILTIALLLIGCYKNPDTVEKYIFVSSWMILCLFLLTNLILRLIYKVTLPLVLKQFNLYLILILSTILCVIFTIIDYNTSPNFIYNRLLLNFQQFGIIALGSLGVGVINANLKWLKKNSKILVFFSGVILAFALGIIRMWPNDVFLVMVQEDNLIENLQFITLIISAIFSFHISYKSFNKNKLISILYLLVGITLFIIAGDEISWGQRILSISTPTKLANNNVQDELNIHNLYFLNNLIGYAYILIGLYGSIGWLIKKIFIKSNHLLLKFLIPPWYLFWYFFLGGFYNFYRLFPNTYNIGEWAEPAELMLNLGVLIFLVGLTYLKPSSKLNLHFDNF